MIYLLKVSIFLLWAVAVLTRQNKAGPAGPISSLPKINMPMGLLLKSSSLLSWVTMKSRYTGQRRRLHGIIQMHTNPLSILLGNMYKLLRRGGECKTLIEPKTCFCWVFNYKLSCYDDVHVLINVDARPHLLLKTRPRLSPGGPGVCTINLFTVVIYGFSQ